MCRWDSSIGDVCAAGDDCVAVVVDVVGNAHERVACIEIDRVAGVDEGERGFRDCDLLTRVFPRIKSIINALDLERGCLHGDDAAVYPANIAVFPAA